MKTLVSLRGPAQFDMCGKFLHYPLRDTDEQISAGLAKRLVAYATERAKNAGLYSMLQGWTIEVYTMDGDDKPADRNYNVKWTNPEGTTIELCQILTKNGWPFLDHRFSMSDG